MPDLRCIIVADCRRMMSAVCIFPAAGWLRFVS
jgi:hypothetical protein